MTEHDFQQREYDQQYWLDRITVKHPNDEILRSEVEEPALDILCEDKEMDG